MDYQHQPSKALQDDIWSRDSLTRHEDLCKCAVWMGGQTRTT